MSQYIVKVEIESLFVDYTITDKYGGFMMTSKKVAEGRIWVEEPFNNGLYQDMFKRAIDLVCEDSEQARQSRQWEIKI